jgi:hypothetical protein
MMLAPLYGGGFEIDVMSCGDVPAFAVKEIWTVALETGVRSKLEVER